MALCAIIFLSLFLNGKSYIFSKSFSVWMLVPTDIRQANMPTCFAKESKRVLFFADILARCHGLSPAKDFACLLVCLFVCLFVFKGLFCLLVYFSFLLICLISLWMQKWNSRQSLLTKRKRINRIGNMIHRQKKNNPKFNRKNAVGQDFACNIFST